MILNNLKTLALMALLAGMLMFLGSLIGGTDGLLGAFIIALILNGIMYFYSDKIVLNMYNAEELNRTEHGDIYATVAQLSAQMGIPMPKLWLIKTPVANAFATGRNPKHASIAITTGILNLLDPHELRGVLAHELSHVVNRDILVSTIAAVFATTIGYIANFLQYAFIWAPRDSKNRGSALGGLIIAMLMPFIALLVRLGISRSREYLADETGAHACHDPLALASALKKLSLNTERASFSADNEAKASTAGLFIVNPFSAESFVELLSTHPPLKKRIEALEKIHLKNHKRYM